MSGIWTQDFQHIYMTGHKDWFVQLDEIVRSQVRFADDNTLTAGGMGKILIQSKDGHPSFITDVLFVPGMKSNLLSLGRLLEKGVCDDHGG